MSERRVRSHSEHFPGEGLAAGGGIEGEALDFSEAIWLLTGGTVYVTRTQHQGWGILRKQKQKKKKS